MNVSKIRLKNTFALIHFTVQSLKSVTKWLLLKVKCNMEEGVRKVKKFNILFELIT